MSGGATLEIEVSFDLICPWCWIGKRQLDMAMALFERARPDVTLLLAWHSHPLMPDIPFTGIPFHEFYVRRLGSEAAVAARQAQVREAVRVAGMNIAFERIETFANTLAAHRLVAMAGDAKGALIEAIFERYFLCGNDIGDTGVLLGAAAECGIDPVAATEALAPRRGDDNRLSAPDAAASAGHGVPYVLFNRSVAVEGAQGTIVLLDAMHRALGVGIPNQV